MLFITAIDSNVIQFFVKGMVRRKILVLDLDETLIHSHHDGVVRQTVKPGTPPDFVLKVTIDRHPVRFFVHKRPHVDFFLDVVRYTDAIWLVSFVSLSLFSSGIFSVKKLPIHRHKANRYFYYRFHSGTR